MNRAKINDIELKRQQKKTMTPRTGSIKRQTKLKKLYLDPPI